MTRVLVAVKRVVEVAGEVVLTDDLQGLDGRYAGHTMSDHDTCAVELALQITEADGGDVTVASIGEPQAVEQVRSALGLGATSGVVVEVDPLLLGPHDVAAELATLVREAQAAGHPFDLVLAGNDAADTGDFQVPIRLAHLLGLPVVTGAATVRTADADGGPAGTGRRAVATVDGSAGTETYEVPLPAVVSILEGGVSPRYPSLKGRMAAKKVDVEVRGPSCSPRGGGRVRWHVPPPPPTSTEVLGEGPEAAAAVVETLHRLQVVR